MISPQIPAYNKGPDITGDLENLWSSDRISDLYAFYRLNPTPADLLRFSKSRPLPPLKIITTRRKEHPLAVAVIPTADSKSEMTRRLVAQLTPYPTVVVESFGRFFNFSHSMNEGIQDALDMSPEWVILINDDMRILDSVRKLSDILSKEKLADCLIPSLKRKLGRLESTSFAVVPRLRVMEALIQSVADLYYRRSRLDHLIHSLLLSKYGVKHTLVDFGRSTQAGPLSAAAKSYKQLLAYNARVFLNIEDFAIIRSDVLTKYRYDRAFINGFEDRDLSIRLELSVPWSRLDFAVERYGGATLSPTKHLQACRELREVLNEVIFFSKYKMLPIKS